MPHATTHSADVATELAADPTAAASLALTPALAPTAIDSLAFARGGGEIAGTVPLAGLPRLVDDALALAGELVVELRGWRDAEGKSWLGLRIQGDMLTRCQRCLESVTLPLRIDSRLQLIAPGDAWPDDDLTDDAVVATMDVTVDAIEADPALDVLALVEDEVLLALPTAPLHARCELPAPAGRVDGSPFAVLATLKKY
jgi:uncharacterized protein